MMPFSYISDFPVHHYILPYLITHLWKVYAGFGFGVTH